MDQLPPDAQANIATAATWLWDQYGKKALEKVVGRAVNEARWRWGIEQYLTSLYERVGFVRILGRMEAEPLENVFTHVNVLDKLTAERRYSIERLAAEFDPRDYAAAGRAKRIAGEEVTAEYPKLFILGKPGAGKTTFLKHTALRAINRQIDAFAVFVTLKELSDSAEEILPFIVQQCRVHNFPDPESFVPRLLEDGKAIVLFDGLDEVNLEDNRRSRLIKMLNDFVFQYSDCQILITCRVAAVDYSFTQFEYVEMADFDDEQIGRYIDQWFVGDEMKRQNCRRALLADAQNKAVHELAQVPLLLSLLCLVYEERNEFPPQRDEIYEEATRALLSKWDASRNISRDTVYPQLWLKQKQRLLAYIAAETFTRGEYFLPEQRVVDLIEAYLQGVPGVEDPDGEPVLKAMEAQHGIFVERARGIHSFSHLTLQEYFTARYVGENEQRGAVRRLMQNVGDERWNEVFVLTAGMLGDASEFCRQYLEATLDLIAADEQLVSLLSWVEQKRQQLPEYYKPPAMRAFLFCQSITQGPDRGIYDIDREINRILALDLARAFDDTLDNALALTHAPNLDRDLALDDDLALDRAIMVGQGHRQFQDELETVTWPEGEGDEDPGEAYSRQLRRVLDKYANLWDPYRQVPVQREEIEKRWQLTSHQVTVLLWYLIANRLLVRCLDVAYTPDREAIENQILLPPA